MDVIVLGGGLMGTTTAYFLARRGHSVTVIERGRVGNGATIASFGNVRRTNRFLPQLPLAHRARAIWGEAERLLGRDVEFRQTGHVRLVFDEDGLADMRAYAEAARPWGLDIEELGPEDIRRRFPGLGPQAVAASLMAEDGCANPRLVCPAFAAATARMGAQIVEDAKVLSVTKTEAGFEVATERGTYAAACLVNTAGAWGARVAALFGEHVPLVARGPQMGVTEPLPHRVLPVVGVWTRVKEEAGYLRQVERGNIIFGGAAKRTEVDLDTGFAKYDPSRLPAQMRALVRLFPGLAQVAVIRTWSGCEGYIADDLPVMGRSATTDGLFHAFGFCGHGFQLGPGVGEMMAELIDTGRSSTSIAPFDIGRFAAA
jgi:sarcosine oxidase subunit beta